MFYRLYSKAKPFKKVPFVLGGIAVAVSTGTSLLSPIIAWIANLVAVACVGFYSISKNKETAQFIMTQQGKIKPMAKRLSLQQYPEAQALIQPHLRAIFDKIIFRNKSVDRIIEEIEFVNVEMNHSQTNSNRRDRIYNLTAQVYSRNNVIAQIISAMISLGVNIWANIGNSKETKSDSQTAKNIAYFNLGVAIVCITSQYLSHMYVAKKLRPIATNAQNGQSILSNAQDSVFFRAVERTARGCNEQISAIIREQKRITEKITRLEKEDEDEEKTILKTEKDEESSIQTSKQIAELEKILANRKAFLLSYQRQFENLPERIQRSENQLLRGFFEPRDIEEETEETEECEETTVRQSLRPSVPTMEEE